MAASRYIYGKNSVRALLEAHPEKVFKIFLADGLKPDKRLQAIQECAHAQRIPIQTVPRPKLDQMLRSQEEAQQQKQGAERDTEANPEGATHQGVVASVAPKALLTLPELIKQCQAKIQAGQHPRVLLLDSITDPRNFGAILRVADAAGVDGVIIPKQHSAGFGPAVSKTASGAEEAVNIAVVANLNNTIRDLKEAGFWIAGAAHEDTAVAYNKQDYAMPIALVMGSEDKGLGSLIRKNCDFLLKIPMHGTVESLNVATATAVLLFEIVKDVNL